MGSNWNPVKYKSVGGNPTTDPIYNKIIHRRLTVSCQPTFDETGLLQAKDPTTLNKENLNKLLLYDSSSDSEEVNDYYAGGYFFATYGQEIGDTIKYKIIRKIGYGQFSTVWMATNVSDKKNYAIKIIKCAQEYRAAGDKEVELLCYIKEHDPKSLGYNRLISIHHFFTTKTFYGTHLCIAFDMMHYTLRDLIDKSCLCGLDEQGSQIIIKQVLEGLVYLHKSCKIIHRDLKPENILVVSNQAELDKMVSYVNHFNKLEVQLPKSCVSTLEWHRYAEWEGVFSTSEVNTLPRRKSNIEQSYHNKLLVNPNIQIKIGDLGNSCFEKNKSSQLIQTVNYRALEVIINAGYSFPADIWSVGCIVYEMRTARYLFNPYQSGLSSSELHLCLIWEALGDIPREVALSGKLSKMFFTSTGFLKLINYRFEVPITIAGVLIEKFQWPRDDAKSFANFIKELLEPDYIKRLTATKALNHKWLNKKPKPAQAI